MRLFVILFTAAFALMAGNVTAQEINLLGHYNTDGQARAISVSGNYAYIADYYGAVPIVSVEDPENPQLVGTGSSQGAAKDIAVDGDYAYVAGWIGGLTIISIADPANPQTSGNYDTPDDAKGVTVSGNYAYVADGGDGGLRIINIEDKANPSEVGYHDTPGGANDVAISGNYAYLADGNSGGFRIISIANPESPEEAGYYDGIGSASGIYVSDGFAYLACRDQGVKVFSIANPAAPELVSSFNANDANNVHVCGRTAFIADRTSGMRIVSFDDFENPSELGLFDTDGEALNVTVVGEVAYVSDYSNGMLILDVSDYNSISEEYIQEPDEYCLIKAYPNPFNSAIQIGFNLKTNADVSLQMLDTQGRVVTDIFQGYYSAGQHNLSWNAKSFQSGAYFIKLQTGNVTSLQKVVMIK